VLARGDGLAELDGPAAHVLSVLDHGHGVGAFGQRTARGDGRAGSGREGDGRLRVHGELRDSLQPGRVGLAGAEQVPRRDGVAVHARSVGEGQVLGRDDVLGQDPAAALFGRDAFRVHGSEPGLQREKRLHVDHLEEGLFHGDGYTSFARRRQRPAANVA